jgi:WD40 repeat protein
VFSADGRICASGGVDGRVMIREVESGRVVRVIEAHSAPVRSLAFTADGYCVLSGGLDDQYWLWAIENGAASWLPIRHTSPIDYCALSTTARYLTTSCADRFVYIWDVPSGALVERIGTRRLFDHLIAPSMLRRELPDSEYYRDRYFPGESIYHVATVRMSPDGAHALFCATTRVAASLRGGGVRVSANEPSGSISDSACLLALNIGTGEVHSIAMSQTQPVSAFAVDANATRLLWAKADHALELWDLRREVRIATLRGHREKVNAVGLSRDGKRAISCSRDRSVRVWDLLTVTEVAAFTADSALRSLALAPDDEVLAVGDTAGRVHFLRLVGVSTDSGTMDDYRGNKSLTAIVQPGTAGSAST